MTTTAHTPALYVALELGQDKWHLAFATQAAEKPRYRTVPARDLDRLVAEIHEAKERFRLPADAPVRTCYEAGRDGFWVHRALVARGIENLVVDSSSIEVNRRRKQVKSDPVDAAKLLNLLCRYHAGEDKVWHVVRAPAVADEDRRQLHRGLKDLQRQQTECSNRIQGLLASYGLTAAVNARFRDTLAELRDWAGEPVPAGLQRRLLQEFAVWEAVHAQVCQAGNEQERRLRTGTEPHLEKVRRLMGLKAVGVRTAWVLVAEVFAWRQIRNGRELGALAGLTPVPYQSGQTDRDQGISKAGNKHVRGLIVELAWLWLRWQPGSDLSRWYARRFGAGGRRARKVGIVALARKLLIALWRYADRGELPGGAAERDWRVRVNSKLRQRAKAAAGPAAAAAA